jgi:carbon starvation protein CstA
MQAVKSVRALTSRSIQSHAKSAASKIVRVTIGLVMTVLVMTVLVMTVLGAIVHKAIVHAPMKRAAKRLAIVMAKASAITRHARALPHAGKPVLKVVPMIASRASQLQVRKPSVASRSVSGARAHAVGPMLVAAVTAPSCHVAAVRKIPAYTRSGPLGLSG